MEWESGNIFIRPSGVLDKGSLVKGHTHNFDHTTIVFTGSIRVTATLKDGRIMEGVFAAPDHFLVRADVEHQIEALEDGTQYWCVYSHRNAQGDVVQVNNGWNNFAYR